MQVLQIIWCFIIRIPLYNQRCGSWYTSHQNAQHPQLDENKCHKFVVERYSLCQTKTNVYRQLKIRDQMTQGKEEKNMEAVINIMKCVDFLTRQKLAVSENTEKIMKFGKHFAELLKWNL